MRKFIILLSLLWPLLGAAQDLITITGTVVDASNGSPLPFAQLTITGTTLGTSSNNDGEFLITIPAVHENDTLLFGYLGYEPYLLPVSHLLNGTVKVRLRPIPIQLTEVEVVGFTPQEVIRRAVEAIPANYGRDSLLLTAFIRVQKIVGNKMAEYTEAIVQDLKDGYYLYPKKDQRKKHDRSNFPLLLKGRVRSDTNLVNSMGDVGRQAFCLSCPFVLDIAEMYHNTALDEASFDKYDYKMKETSDIEGRKVYHITYDQKDNVNDMLYRGDIYIRATGFVIEKVIYKPSMKAYDTYEKTKYKRPFEIRNTPGWIMEMPMGQNIVTYAERDGRWTLATIRNDYAMVYVNTQTNKKVRYQYKTDLVVTDVQRDKAVLKSFKGNKSLGADQRWDQLVGTADEGFWAKYNFLPVEDALKKSLKEMKYQ
jgi:hypothetical protein